MKRLSNNTIIEGLEALGKKLPADRNFEVVIIGGAAGVLMGQLPGAHTTGDVDTIQFRAAKDRDVVLDTAAQVGRELSLPLYWMNDVSGLFAWTLQDGWEERRQKICEFGSLIVYTVSRLDLIAMKFMAHRPADFEHLQDLNVTSDEVEFVHSYLDNKELGHPEHSDQIALARSYLSNWL